MWHTCPQEQLHGNTTFITCVCVTGILCNTVSCIPFKINTCTRHIGRDILDISTYKGHTLWLSINTHSICTHTFDRLWVSVITGLYATQLLESQDCMFREAPWFEETTASITWFTLTTAWKGFWLVHLYCGMNLTNESVGRGGNFRVGGTSTMYRSRWKF